MKPFSLSFSVRSTALLLAALVISPVAFARENHFRPILGEVISSSVGPERVVVGEEGGLSVFTYAGDLAPNFPVYAANAVFVTSPVPADFSGDSAHEVAVVARDAAGAYTLLAYAGDGSLVASTPLPEGVYFDPLVRANAFNRRDELFVVTVAGNVWRVRFDVATTSFVKTLMVNLGQAAGLTLDPITRNQIYVNFPEQSSIAVYSIDTRGTANAWTLDRTLTLSSPVLYPMIVSALSGTTPVQSGLYGVNRANAFVGLSASTGALLPGFPVALSSAPIDAPIRSNLEASASSEAMVVPLADGSRAVVNFSGQIVPPLAEVPRFSGDQNVAREGVDRGVISPLGTRGTRVLNRLGERVLSLYGRLRAATSEQTDPDMQVIYRGAVISTGGTLALGPVPTLTNTDFILTVFNAGTRDLILTGAPTLTMTGADAADFQIAEYPRSLVTAKEGNRFIVRFRPQTEGVKSAVLSIPNTNSGKNPYTVSLTGSGHSSFRSLAVGTPTLRANGTDIQSATLVLRSENPERVDEASIIVNYPQTGQPNLARGRFQWSATGGFASIGGAAFGQPYVNLLPVNASTPGNGSERLVDPANQTLTFIFRWTLNPAYGNMPVNTVAYHFGESSNRHAVGWVIPDTALFAVTTPVVLSTFQSLTALQSNLIANGSALQTIQLVLRTPTPEMVDSASIIINKPTPTTNQSRGYFQWSPARGFESVGGAAYGAQHVRLITTGPDASTRVINAAAQTVTFFFRYTLNPSYGTVADNDVSYSFGESSRRHTIPWTPVNTSFSVTPSVVLSTFQSLTVSAPVVRTNDLDVQTAELRLRASNPGAIDVVRIIVNKPTGTVNQARGYFQWSPTRGFESVGGRAYGAQHVTLLRANPASPGQGSEYRNNGDGTVSYFFRWRMKPSSGAIPDNDISYYFGESSNRYSVGWRVVDTSFAVVRP